MNELVEILKTETKSLKSQFLDKTEGFAKKYWESNVEKYLGYSYEMWVKDFPVACGKSFTLSKEGSKKRDEISSIYRSGLDKYVSKEVKKAEIHYENSIQKLAIRILGKGLVIENLKIKTSHIGVNIETILTDGEKTVKAWTIIAEGPIQRPHYRYLVK